MKRLELAKKLKEEGISDRAISFQPANDKYSLVEESGRWIVYFNERGVMTHHREFVTEDEACEHLYQLLRSRQRQ